MKYPLVMGLIVVFQVYLFRTRPNHFYFIPIFMVVVPFCIFLALNTFSGKKRITQIAHGFFCFVIFCLGAHLAKNSYLWASALKEDRQTLERWEIFREQSRCHWAGYYTSPLLTYALAFANSYEKGRYSETLRRLYPDSLQYHEGPSEGFSHFGLAIPDSIIRQWMKEGQCFVIFGNLSRIREGAVFVRNLRLKFLREDRSVAYQVNALD